MLNVEKELNVLKKVPYASKFFREGHISEKALT